MPAGRWGAAEPLALLWVWREGQHLNHISPAVGNHSNTSSCASQLNPVDCTYIKSFLSNCFLFQEGRNFSLQGVYIYLF